MLSRPLQPNPATAPPTLLQALNRYAATPVGQPGVYQARESTWNPFTDDYSSNIGKGIFSNGLHQVRQWCGNKGCVFLIFLKSQQ